MYEIEGVHGVRQCKCTGHGNVIRLCAFIKNALLTFGICFISVMFSTLLISQVEDVYYNGELSLASNGEGLLCVSAQTASDD